ncbi:MAG: hypothetical protein CMD33_08195 [Flavobacteriales bacterium]|nr:hypothetical protein [Flavobacteriales bacterium]
MNDQMLTYGRVLIPLVIHVLFFQHAAFAAGWWFVGLHLLGLLLMPLQSSPLLLLVVAAGFGSTVDAVSFEGGLFMSSAVFMALAIPTVNRLLAPREGYEITDHPTVSSMGLQWFALRCLLLLSVHHLWMFGLEAGRWDLIPRAIGKAMVSSLLSTGAFVLILLLTRRQQTTR